MTLPSAASVFDVTSSSVQRLLSDSLGFADDGELFVEQRQSEAFSFDDGRLKVANYDISSGFGLRAVADEFVAYAHAAELTEEALKRAAQSVKSACRGYQGHYSASPAGAPKPLYASLNPLERQAFDAKVTFLQTVDAYIRAKDPRVCQVSLSLLATWQDVTIARVGGHVVRDVRPLVRFNVSVVVTQNGRQESGSYGMGGRVAYDDFLQETRWQGAAHEALRQALVNLDSVEAPAGEMEVILGAGWPGILLHEAVGHGLEGDFNRKKSSVFSGLMGQQVAAKGVTVIDDGTISDRRGSLTVDDEGTPTQRTVLIEDGILVGYMQDRQNSRLMGTQSTGNGRRESYAHVPMPRMTNTFMTAGHHTPEEMISSVKKGIYAVNFGGGQVDITSGKFVFSCTEAYKIENGKIGAPVKGATLIGNGPESLKYISMIGNDLKLDDGVGTCGKAGQGVPVGVGQPTLKLDRMIVGGTAA
jgi:TldD protein